MRNSIPPRETAQGVAEDLVADMSGKFDSWVPDENRPILAADL